MILFPTTVSENDPTKRRPRLGLIAPASDILIERDFWRMGLAAGVDIFTTRIPLDMPLTPITLARLADGIAGATERLLPEETLDAVVFGCTSGSAVIGAENVAARVHSIRPHLGVTNPAIAAVAALEYLQAKRIAFVAPYTADVAEQTASVFTNAGITITDARCLGLLTDAQIAVPGPDHYHAVLSDMDTAQAQAIFLSCTTSRALDSIESLEQATGLPVVTSNQASFWHAMQMMGVDCSIPGLGRLLS
ncbi:ectoine utilization protein EutA [Metapseudomonas resinovorans]|uniref:maleate cis-trans isomerase family protein n=1 Tax=Metapseudomonas resinovorans TaxID=53412 RepID=UPI00131CF93F|nr:Asp/Glu racemase [Pseudomonas resinovorans]GLZ87902.1 ectoine utilization protein EutA [Pseudomonas resinovorans]